MKTSFKVLFLMLFLGLFPFSCEIEKEQEYHDPCFGTSSPRWFIRDMESITLQISKHGDKFADLVGVADTSKFYDNDAVGLGLLVTDFEKVAFQKLRLSFFNTNALACTPLYIYTNRVKQIVITASDSLTYTNYGFIKKDQDITDFFDVFLQTSPNGWQIYGHPNEDIGLPMKAGFDYPVLFISKYDSEQEVTLPLQVHLILEDTTFRFNHTLRLD